MFCSGPDPHAIVDPLKLICFKVPNVAVVVAIICVVNGGGRHVIAESRAMY